ncbi:hypothetical protein [Streptomyces sp. NBC_00019]|uniref:hypothetical protein n=1 Tax=Streptomyces sp. NBC_00019 TaxID=2975623 RepID=UPI003247354D
MGPSLIAPVAVSAMLVIRTALMEIRHPGSARRQWAFLTNRQAVTTGATVVVLLSAVGWRTAGFVSAAWALLAGALVAHLVNLSTGSDTQGRTDRGDMRR